MADQQPQAITLFDAQGNPITLSTAAPQAQKAVDRADKTATPKPTEVAPDPNSPKTTDEEKKKEELEAAEKKKQLLEAQESAEQTLFFIKIAQFIILFGFGTLTIIGVGALIFYGLDWAASLFDFDLSEYTQWIILLLTLINMIMSCCGCYGTYKFSDFERENRSKLIQIKDDLGETIDKIGKDNDELAETLRKFEVEITHFEAENKELMRSLNNFERHTEDVLKGRKQEATLFVTMRELWNLQKIMETNDTIAKITKITAEYYIKAYQDHDLDDGINEEQYKHLVESAVVSRGDKKYFPPFNDSRWDKDRNQSILVDEFERMLVMIYKKILADELRIELSEQGRAEILQFRESINLDETRDILQQSGQHEEEKENRSIWHL